MKNEIPPMTDPLGKHWKQPKTEDILIDDTHAVMGLDAFDALENYSHSQPSGVYPGKMWRGWGSDENGIFWWLRWYGFSEMGEGFCSNNQRRILILRP